jgi:hypothetical protein
MHTERMRNGRQHNIVRRKTEKEIDKNRMGRI